MSKSLRLITHKKTVVWDFEHDMLRSVSRYVDGRLADLSGNMKAHEWLKENWLDPYEYFAGMGFIAGQRFITASQSRVGLTRKQAVSLGAQHKVSGWSLPAIIDAAANYWKHHDEWKKDSLGRGWLINRHNERVARILNAVGCWNATYACSEILFHIAERQREPFLFLADQLKEWHQVLRKTSENHS